jgi:uncharacterized LabA/DUF88 family protein
MFKREKVVVYIDGGNTYRRLKESGVPEKDMMFDYSNFVQYLIGNRQLVSKRYYIGVVKNADNTEKGEKMVKSQQKFLSGLETENFDIKRGRIMYDNHSVREKGVDVKLAVDLVVGASDDLYDTAIIISSDTDLIPAIKYIIKAKNKKVEYVGFSNNPSFGLLKESTERRLFSKTDLVEFQKKK